MFFGLFDPPSRKTYLPSCRNQRHCDPRNIRQEGLVTHDQALVALESMDDYAKMSISVDPIGPRKTLERYIEQQRASQGS